MVKTISDVWPQLIEILLVEILKKSVKLCIQFNRACAFK